MDNVNFFQRKLINIMEHKIDFDNPGDKNLINDLLVGASLDEFIFNTIFKLVFCCDTKRKVSDKNVPPRVSLSILGDWWFGDKDEWNKTVEKLTEGYNYVEPDEPVLAYKLAALRWNGDATITSVKLTEKELKIIFNYDDSITILNNAVEDSSWEIWEMSNNCIEDYKYWYVICEDGEIFYNIPL